MASPLRISSSKNPKLLNAVKLRDSKHRKAQGLFLIDGTKSIDIAIRSGIKIREFFLNEEHPEASNLSKIFSLQGGDSYFISSMLMEKLSYGEQSHECVAVAESFDTSIDSIAQRLNDANVKRGQRSGLFLVIDRIEKPGNLGAILRTADAAGVEGVLLSDSICDLFNPNAIRSSLGAIFTLPIAASSMDNVARWLQSQNISIYTARVEGSNEYTSTEFAERSALVVGNEATGLGSRWMDKSYHAVRIPMVGKIDSLNASVSTAIILFEMVRQRTVRKA